jgi:hypothetical protein
MVPRGRVIGKKICCFELIIHVSFSLRQVAESWDSLDGWLDAIRLVYTIFARGKSDVLAGIITG